MASTHDHNHRARLELVDALLAIAAIVALVVTASAVGHLVDDETDDLDELERERVAELERELELDEEDA